MERITLRLAMLLTTAIVLTTAPVHDTFADEPAPRPIIPDSALPEPPTPAPAQEEQHQPSDMLQPADAGDVQERGVFRQFQLPQGTFPAPSGTTPAPATKIPVPGITAPTPGTVLPPDRYQASTPNLTLIANALRLNHKSLTTLVTLPPNLSVTRPVDIGIIYTSPTGIGQTKQSYAGGTGNRFLYNDREGDGKPRAMDIAITLTEPSAGEVGIYRMKWQANLDPLYDVAMGRFEFTLLNFCDTAGQTEIRLVWALPDARSYSHRGWSTAIVPDTTQVPEFTWVRSEVSWSQPLHQESFTFVDDDPGWVEALSTIKRNLDIFWDPPGFSQPLAIGDLLATPTGGQWVTGVRKAENDSCKGRFKYWRAKNLLLYPTLQTR
ncbi:MAG: hypothetical protein NTNFB02_34040 [Nitrospira sp.]